MVINSGENVELVSKGKATHVMSYVAYPYPYPYLRICLNQTIAIRNIHLC